MAVLIRDENQIKACDEINAMLSEVKTINTLIEAGPVSGFSLVVTKKQALPVDHNFDAKIITVLKQQRARRIKSILSKADKFHIALDKADLEIISERHPENKDPSETEN